MPPRYNSVTSGSHRGGVPGTYGTIGAVEEFPMNEADEAGEFSAGKEVELGEGGERRVRADERTDGDVSTPPNRCAIMSNVNRQYQGRKVHTERNSSRNPN